MSHQMPEQAVTVLLSEYEALKAEQRSRIGFRDQLLYAMLTAAAAITAVTATAGRLELLLVLPLAGLVLGWTHTHNDHMITQIGTYVRDGLGPRLIAVIGPAGPAGTVGAVGDGSCEVFGWERDHRGDRRRRSRAWLQLGVNLAAFCVPPLAALVVVWASGPHPGVLAVSLAELAVVAVLATQIVRYAGLAHR